MGYLATDIARIPSEGYEWYIFLLEDGWNDDLRRELTENFLNFVREVGPNVLVVRGTEPRDFRNALFDRYVLHRDYPDRSLPLPAILVSNLSPSAMNGKPEAMEAAKIILFPLDRQYLRPSSITNFLQQVAQAAQDTRSFDALESLDEVELERRWGWITEYFDLKPNFFGFGLNLNKVMDRLFLKSKNKQP
jgi:hypothetical protein